MQKKSYFLNGSDNGGGGEKITFFMLKKILIAIKLEGGKGGKALMALPLRKELFYFCGFPYRPYIT